MDHGREVQSGHQHNSLAGVGKKGRRSQAFKLGEWVCGHSIVLIFASGIVEFVLI